LAPSDIHLFGPLKEAIRGKRYDNDEQVLGDVRTWLRERERPLEWYRAGIHALTKRWRKAIDLNGDYVEKR
ncbi:Mariner Mos1 transposase, partial [Blattella germanica]